MTSQVWTFSITFEKIEAVGSRGRWVGQASQHGHVRHKEAGHEQVSGQSHKLVERYLLGGTVANVSAYSYRKDAYQDYKEKVQEGKKWVYICIIYEYICIRY